MDKRLKKFTIADRLAILHEYETSDLTGAEIAQKYGIKSASTISTWKSRLYNSKKVVPLQAKIKEAEQWKMPNVNNY